MQMNTGPIHCCAKHVQIIDVPAQLGQPNWFNSLWTFLQGESGHHLALCNFEFLRTYWLVLPRKAGKHWPYSQFVVNIV